MRFRSKKSHPNVIVTQANRVNEDQLQEDASLKAAQAIYKKYRTVNVGNNPSANSLSVITTPTASAPIRSPRSTRPYMTPKSTNNLLGLSNAEVSGHAASLALEASRAESSPVLAEGGDLLMPPGIYLDGNIRERAYSSNSSRCSSRLSVRNSPTSSLLHEKLNSPSSESFESSVLYEDRDVGRTNSMLKDSFQLGGYKAGNPHLLSSPCFSSSSIMLPPQRKPPPSSQAFALGSLADDNGEDSIEFNVDNLTYDKTNKSSVPITYEGTLPDLIPAPQRRRRKKWTNIFSNGKPSVQSPESQFTLNVEDDSLTLKTKPANQTRFRTTLRRDEYQQNENLDHGDDSDLSSDSSVYEENYDRKHASRIQSTTPSKVKHRNLMRPSRKQTFNEDKPWKSHVDIGFVSEKERKRYEGVWVTNKNQYLELLPWWNPEVTIPPDGLVINQVVFEIWSRSNLSSQLLAQIYDKVDTRKDGTLNRQSFVIGMWLVDQCLYGRKLPQVIDQRVWDSVDKFVINIPNNNPHHLYRTRKKMLRKELKTIKKDNKNTQT